MENKKGYYVFVDVASSCIDEVGFFSLNEVYNEDHLGTVRIVFLNGTVYDYLKVPYKEFRFLAFSASSVGSYYHTYIKGSYVSSKVESRDSDPFNDGFNCLEDKGEKSLSTSSKITIYSVYEPIDTIEGRGGNRIIGYFMYRKVAEHVLKEYTTGVMGSKCGTGIHEIKVDVSESVFDYEDSRTEKVRKSALAKLTEEEKKALGL